MERAERVVAICAGLAFSFLLVPLLWLMLALTALTALQRFVKVWRQGTPQATAERRAVRVAAGGAHAPPAARWRAWREANGWAPRQPRFANGSGRSGAGARWRERRQTRLERRATEEAAEFRRHPGTRRP
jgi:hypothetical protein